MKRTAMKMIVMATSMILGSMAYALGTDDLHKSEAGASQNHDTHCCKPDPNDMKAMQGMAEHRHDHAQVPKKPAKKPADKAAKEKIPEAK